MTEQEAIELLQSDKVPEDPNVRDLLDTMREAGVK